MKKPIGKQLLELPEDKRACPLCGGPITLDHIACLDGVVAVPECEACGIVYWIGDGIARHGYILEFDTNGKVSGLHTP